LRIPRPLAWGILVLGLFTAGLLRQFHHETPTSPWVPPVVGSLLFAAVFLMLLLAAWEHQRGGRLGRGVRLAVILPLLLMLFVEKWVAITLWPWLFWHATDPAAPAAVLDAQYRGFVGAGLVALCLLLARFSRPTRRRVWRRSRPRRLPIAIAVTALAVSGAYVLLGGLAALLGGRLALAWPRGALLPWVIGGQALLAFAEELYFRGLLLFELLRIAPRLGVRERMLRRWIALGGTAVLFGIEHVALLGSEASALRELVFTVSLGLLLGILVLVSRNLHLAAGVHAWINLLVLGAVPYFIDGAGEPALPPGTYIAMTLILAFVLVFVAYRWGSGAAAPRRPPGALVTG
jgi:membrane protease YdiL (CAAX protease family)